MPERVEGENMASEVERQNYGTTPHRVRSVKYSRLSDHEIRQLMKKCLIKPKLTCRLLPQRLWQID